MQRSAVFPMILIAILLCAGCEREPQKAEESRSENGSLQKCLNKACFPEEKEVSGQRFRLIGLSSLIKYVKFVVYTAAFYLPEREPAIEVPPEHDAKILTLYYQRDLEKKQVIDSLRRDLNSMRDVKMKELEERFKQLEDAFVAPVKGDEYEFLFIPGAGMTMAHNGKILTTIQGDDFGYAFFGVWISPYVEDQAMRDELLGGLVAAKPAKRKSEELAKKISKIGPSMKETTRKIFKATAETARDLNPITLGKKTWRWISREASTAH